MFVQIPHIVHLYDVIITQQQHQIQSQMQNQKKHLKIKQE